MEKGYYIQLIGNENQRKTVNKNFKNNRNSQNTACCDYLYYFILF